MNKQGIMIGLSGLFLLSTSSVLGIQLGDGRTAFTGSPRLLNAVTTFSNVQVWSAKYYFTLDLPENIGEPLQKVSFQQKESPEIINFYLDKTFAFSGTPSNRGEDIPIQESVLNPEDNSITVIFARPVPAGKTLTVGLRPVRNPNYGGVYLFGVTAFPAGENPVGMYLGAGRLQFYQNGDFNY
jgi:hypothetical protein